MKPVVLSLWVLCASSLLGLPEPEPSGTPLGPEFKTNAKEIAEMEKQLARAIQEKDTAFLEKVLAEHYYDVYEGDKRALSKSDTIARCKAGLLKYLNLEKEQRTRPDEGSIAVEGVAKLIPNRQDDTIPPEQWLHVRRLWTKKDGNWVLKCQIRRLEGDDGKGEED
jgi:hypothetical protein